MANYRNVLVTGGAGFVGSNLASWLKARYPGMHVIAADNLRRRGVELTLPHLRDQGIEFVHCDIRNPEDMRFGERAIDLILECSAEPSVRAGYGDAPDYVINTNLVGTVNCLELARRCQADMIFLSSSRVYPIHTLNSIAVREDDTRFAVAPAQPLAGISACGISEHFPLEGPRSLYGATKLCSELLIQEYGAMYGLRYIINRCGVLTGPWQMGKADQGVFAFWVAMHYFRRELSYVGWGGQGKQVRDLLHVADLAELIDRQLSSFEALSGQTYNVGGGMESSLSLQETTRLCQEITGHMMPVRSIQENSPADVKWYVTDTTRVRKATGWCPQRTPYQTLAAIYAWLKESEPLVRHIWLT